MFSYAQIMSVIREFVGNISETIYLVLLPEMLESIVEGIKTPIADCDSEIIWDLEI